VGDTFQGCEVKNMVPFGVFVELQPGVDGFCHISELSEKYIKNIDDVVLAAGDSVDVKVVQINKNGQYRIMITSEFEVKTPQPGANAKATAGRSKAKGGGQ
jgi:predicted RNA-binding protein with RPS1 domain